MSFNLATIVREWATRAPERPALRAGDLTWTYRDLDAVSGRVAAGLRAAGLRPGAAVAVQLPNIPEFVAAYLGILKAGLVAVPLNPLLRAPEIAYHVADSRAVVLITTAAGAGEAAKGLAAQAGVRLYVVGAGDAPPDGAAPFEDLLGAGGDDGGEIHPTDPGDTAVLIYTSGTTGRPKGAVLSHFHLFMACTVGGEIFGYRPDDVSLLVLPLFHVFGFSSTLNVSLRYGGSVVLVPRFSGEAVLDAVERHRCTVFCGVPTMYMGLLAAGAGGRNLSSLRRGVSGGAAMPAEVLRKVEEAFPEMVVLEGYGLSETVAMATFNTSARSRRVGSIGQPVWGMEVKVVDDAGRELPPGSDHVGELVIRGHTVFDGYIGRPAETADVLRNGWFHTGDLGYRDEEGFLYIVDRKKDLIIRGGYNVYPREVEEVLHEHPDVVEAGVVGRTDERLGEEVVAFVVLRGDASASPDGLVAHCQARLAAYKYPRRVVVLDGELPKNAAGKVLKTVLRERV
jgi:long-chain acyl-CoA synthetase